MKTKIVTHKFVGKPGKEFCERCGQDKAKLDKLNNKECNNMKELRKLLSF